MRAAFLDNWAETDPELFDDDFDHFPVQPNPGSTIAQCVRGASETGRSDVATLFRALLPGRPRTPIRITTAYFVPDDEILDRLCGAQPTEASRSSCSFPGPHADKRFVQLAGEAAYERAARSRRRDLDASSRRCCTPRS